MALGDLLGGLLDSVLSKIKAVFAPFGKVVDIISNTFTNFRKAFDNGMALTGEILSEINEWKNFKENVHVKSRVISLPLAIDKTQDLLNEIKAAWNSIVDLAKQFRDQAEASGEGNPTEEAEQAIADIESSGFKGLIDKFPKLAKGAEKLLGFLALIAGALESIASAINDIQQIVSTVKAVREEIETGDTVFLSQKNKRKDLALADGGSIKVRLGKLHS